MSLGKLLLGVLLAWGVCQVAFAEETAVLNDAPGFVTTVKDAITRLNPSYETVWDFGSGEFSQGVSASLYNFTSHEIPIASARLGAGTNEILYAGASLDLPGITRRYVPSVVKGFAMTGPLDTVWAFVGKYARVGVVGGYGFSENEPVYGLTAGAAIGF